MTRREAIEILTRHANCLTDTLGSDALHAALAIAVADMAKVHALTKRNKKAYLQRRKSRAARGGSEGRIPGPGETHLRCDTPSEYVIPSIASLKAKGKHTRLSPSQIEEWARIFETKIDMRRRSQAEGGK